MSTTLEWEELEFDPGESEGWGWKAYSFYRARVPNGWLVMTYMDTEGPEAVTFVPDENYEWDD